MPAETKLALDKLLNARSYPADFCDRLGSDTPVRL